jgi:exosortase A-associated hydrolase 2
VNAPSAAFEITPFFLPGIAGDLFSVLFQPRAPVTRGVLYCPPFAEEMNKARRMAALQARALAQRGIAVLFVDPFGTGDSAGDFGAARWETWQDDLRRAAGWLTEHGCARLTLWGLRSGALLAAPLARDLGDVCERLLLWQPVVRGEQMMTQFLRLRLAADLVAAGEKITTQQLRERLYRGEAVEIAGYTIAPELIRALDVADLQSGLGASRVPVDWFDVAAAARALTPVSAKVIEAWRAQGNAVRAEVVVGESFWNTPEIALVPELVDRTTACVCELAA